MPEIIIERLETLEPRIQQLITHLSSLSNVWAFDAPMGAGKTTIIREICKQIGVIDTVTSPTFSIINEYKRLSGNNIYHFDFYRIENIADALAIGVAEYIESNNLCLIEWPSVVEPILPDNYILINIAVESEQSRRVKWLEISR